MYKRQVVVNASMPEPLAFRLLCVLYQQRPELEKVVKVASYTTPDNLHRLPAVPLHPGAQRYLETVAQVGVSEINCAP